jgi:hypothetical protein
MTAEPTARDDAGGASGGPSAHAPTEVPPDEAAVGTGAGTPARRPAGEGEMCGGIAGIFCATGLSCRMVGPTHPDQAGTCVRP